MKPRSCSRCLLTDEVPGIGIDDQGLCTVCRDYDKQWGNWDKVKKGRLAELEELFAKAKKKKRAYDVMVPLSGGKDSTYVLYLCRKRFDLRCLAVTFDNGFLSDHARQNIRKACEILGADHIYFAPDRSVLMRLYRHAFMKTGFFCPICLNEMGYTVMSFQKALRIPYAISGTSRRTEEHISREFFVCSPDFAENVYVGSPLEREAKNIIEPVGTFKCPPAIRLPDYLDWRYDEIFSTITRELGWVSHRHHAEHTDCVVDDIVNWVRYKRFPQLIPEKLRFSKLVTVGQMDREEAAQKVSEQEAQLQEPTNIPMFLEALKITREEFDAAVADPLKHLPYLKSQGRVIRRLKPILRRLGIAVAPAYRKK